VGDVVLTVAMLRWSLTAISWLVLLRARWWRTFELAEFVMNRRVDAAFSRSAFIRGEV
jgi:hypothetical protein